MEDLLKVCRALAKQVEEKNGQKITIGDNMPLDQLFLLKQNLCGILGARFDHLTKQVEELTTKHKTAHFVIADEILVELSQDLTQVRKDDEERFSAWVPLSSQASLLLPGSQKSIIVSLLNKHLPIKVTAVYPYREGAEIHFKT